MRLKNGPLDKIMTTCTKNNEHPLQKDENSIMHHYVSTHCWVTQINVYFRNNKEIGRLKSIISEQWPIIRMNVTSFLPDVWNCYVLVETRCNLTSQQVRGQVSRQGPNKQPVTIGRQLALVVTIRAIEALIECVWPWPAAGRYTEPGACWPSTRVPYPGAIWSVGVPKPRNPFPCTGVSRWEIGAGISPSSAIKYRAALFAPHAVSGLPRLFCFVCAL